MKKLLKFVDFINENHTEKTYAPSDSKVIEDVIIVNGFDALNDNPLLYVIMEYPKYSEIVGGKLHYNYEYYLDNKGNKYLYISDINNVSDEQLLFMVQDTRKWDIARNVDEYVNGADKEEYIKWLEAIK